MLTAGGATFAAFPEWYASLFSGFYLALLVILVALRVRASQVADVFRITFSQMWGALLLPPSPPLRASSGG